LDGLLIFSTLNSIELTLTFRPIKKFILIGIELQFKYIVEPLVILMRLIQNVLNVSVVIKNK